jgi:hypothetical protein
MQPRKSEQCSYKFDLGDDDTSRVNEVLLLEYTAKTSSAGTYVKVYDSVNELDLPKHDINRPPGNLPLEYVAADFSVTLKWTQAETFAVFNEGFQDVKAKRMSFTDVCGSQAKFMNLASPSDVGIIQYPDRVNQVMPSSASARCLYTLRALTGYAVKWEFAGSGLALHSAATLDIVSGSVGELVIANDGAGYQNSDNVEKRYSGGAGLTGTSVASMQTSFVLFNSKGATHARDNTLAIPISWSSVQSCVNNEIHHSDGTCVLVGVLCVFSVCVMLFIALHIIYNVCLLFNASQGKLSSESCI